MTTPATTRRDRLVRQGLWLAALTIAWNVLEAAVAVGAGMAAGSMALVAFGFDSVVEVASAGVVVWQFRHELRGGHDEQRELRALRWIAATFFVLAAYVTVESVRDLAFGGAAAEASPVGVVLAATSLVVMPALAFAKRRVASRLGSPTFARRREGDAAVRLAVGRAPRRAGRQRRAGVVVGRPAGCAGHRRLRRRRGPRGLGRRAL